MSRPCRLLCWNITGTEKRKGRCFVTRSRSHSPFLEFCELFSWTWKAEGRMKMATFANWFIYLFPPPRALFEQQTFLFPASFAWTGLIGPVFASKILTDSLCVGSSDCPVPFTCEISKPTWKEPLFPRNARPIWRKESLQFSRNLESAWEAPPSYGIQHLLLLTGPPPWVLFASPAEWVGRKKKASPRKPLDWLRFRPADTSSSVLASVLRFYGT